MLDIFQKMNKQQKDVHPKKLKAGSLPERNKNISQNNRKFLNKISAQGFRYLKWTMNCCFF